MWQRDGPDRCVATTRRLRQAGAPGRPGAPEGAGDVRDPRYRSPVAHSGRATPMEHRNGRDDGDGASQWFAEASGAAEPYLAAPRAPRAPNPRRSLQQTRTLVR